MEKIIVLAGSRIEFEEYLNRNGLTDTEAVYGLEPNRIAGIIASKVEVVGTFWERKDAGELLVFAESRIRLPSPPQ